MDQDDGPWRLARRRGRFGAALAAALVARLAAPASACDLCAIYTTTEMMERRIGLRIGVAEQFTRFATLQRGGEKVANPFDEHLNSSITQILLGYNFTERLGLQLNLPIVSRTFRRRTAGGVENDDETGFGDLSLIGGFNAFSAFTAHTVFRASLFGGLKLPSGDSERLSEEIEADHHVDPIDLYPNLPPGFEPPKRPRFRAEHGSEVESGIHGHDLALGSGSVDGVVGGRLFASWRRLFMTGSIQYVIRTEGDFDYRYADDLLWGSSLGMFVFVGHGLARRDCTLGLSARLSGESKGKDTLDGEKEDDTAITSMYVGPGIVFTWGTSLTADLGGELPVLLNNSSLQIVPDYRLRGGLTWRF